MPLWNFIQVVVHDKIEFLIKEGKPTAEEISDAWNIIFTEYSDLKKGKGHTYIVQITREIRYIETKLMIMQACIDRLKVSYYKKACDVLIEYGFSHPFTTDSMLDDLQNVVSEGQFLVVQLGVKKNELQKYLESNKGDDVTEQDFIKELAVLSKHQGYQLKTKDLTVSEYVAIFNSFKEQNGG